MQVSREKVIAMFAAMGWPTASKWNKKRMRAKLKEVAFTAGEDETVIEDDEELDALLQRIVKADGEVEIVDGEVEEEPDEQAGPTDEQVEKAEQEEAEPGERNPVEKPKKENPKVDRFGSPLGTHAAVINACLSEKPKTMKALMKESGIDSTFYNQMKKLIAGGFVEKVEEGYKLKD